MRRRTCGTSFGRNLKSDDKQAVFIKNAQDYKLPKRGVTINYIIAKEDYYFVYPTEYHKYLKSGTETVFNMAASRWKKSSFP